MSLSVSVQIGRKGVLLTHEHCKRWNEADNNEKRYSTNRKEYNLQSEEVEANIAGRGGWWGHSMKSLLGIETVVVVVVGRQG